MTVRIIGPVWEFIVWRLGHMSVTTGIYTPLHIAASLTLSNQSSTLANSLDSLTQRLLEQPRAVLFRQVATPNFELQLFAELAAAAGLQPLILEYHRDKFVTRNFEKLALAKMSFFDGLGRNGGPRLGSAMVARLSEIDGNRLDLADTTWGQRLVDFHLDLLNCYPTLAGIERVEASDWFGERGPAAAYYPDLLELFSGGPILFESFWNSGEEGEFLKRIVEPAFVAAENRGRRPLICRLYPEQYDDDPHWSRYPGELMPLVRDRLESARTSICQNRCSSAA